MRIYKTNKVVLSLHNNPGRFLNGITSNDINAPRNAFLNLHGRIVATFDQVKINDDGFYIVFERRYLDDVLNHIDKFAKLSGVFFEEMETNAYFDLDGDAHLTESVIIIPQKKGKLIITDEDLVVNVSEKQFTLFRVKNHIPVHGIDYKNEMLLNVSMDEFVSFTKGCYLGQEPISKVYHRSKPTWRLVVKSQEECDDDEKVGMTSRVEDPETRQTIGFVFERNMEEEKNEG